MLWLEANWPMRKTSRDVPLNSLAAGSSAVHSRIHAFVALGVVVQVVRPTAVRRGAVRRVELAVPRRAGGGELRVERDPHQPRLVGEHRVVEADVAGADVQVGDRLHPVLVGDVQRPAQVVEDQAPRAVPDRRQVLDAGIGQVRDGVQRRLLGLRRAYEPVRLDDQVALAYRLGNGVVDGLHLRPAGRAAAATSRASAASERASCMGGSVDRVDGG